MIKSRSGSCRAWLVFAMCAAVALAVSSFASAAATTTHSSSASATVPGCASYGAQSINLCGAIRQRYDAVDATPNALGSPISPEVATTGPFTRYGDRHADFSNGSIYLNPTTDATHVITWHVLEANGRPGPALSQLSKRPKETSTATPTSLPPGGCPAGTTNYPGAKYVYSCRNVFPDSTGYPVGLRIGFETIGTGSGNDGDDTIVKGFGLVHAQEDHNVGPHSIALIVADAPPEQGKEPAHPTRYLYRIAGIEAPGNIVEILNVVVQKSPDETGNAPDRYDFGVVTAFCSVGTGRPGYPGYCSDDLPPPFNGGADN